MRGLQGKAHPSLGLPDRWGVDREQETVWGTRHSAAGIHITAPTIIP